MFSLIFAVCVFCAVIKYINYCEEYVGLPLDAYADKLYGDSDKP
jgi:hypothetical protein